MPVPLPRTEAQTALNESSLNRRPDIQGLRAVAVLLVVAFHAGLPVPGGFIGVDVFFVISGFVITAMLHREWRSTGSIRFKRFYLSRFKRLTPALALVVAVTMIISMFVLAPFGAQQNAAKTAIGSMLLIANFVISRTTGGYFDAPAETNPLLNTWSLSVEEQFYLVFPALIALGWMLARRKGLLRFSPPALIFGVGIVSFALAWKGAEFFDALAQQGFTWRSSEIFIGFYSPFTRAWEFAAGALLALALAKRTVQAPRLLTGSGFVGAAMLAASLWLITDTTPFPGAWTLLPVTGTLLLLYAGTNPTALTSQILSTRPMIKVGDWSYSIYLWHWPFIVFAGVLWPQRAWVLIVAAALSLIPAMASFRWVEQPLRNARGLTLRRWATLLTVTLAPPLLVASVLWYASEAVSESSAPGAEQSQWADNYRNCSDLPALTESECWRPGNPTAPPVFLLGDSNARMYSDATFAATDRPVFIGRRGACPFLPLTKGDEDCQAFYRSTISGLSNQSPGTVILAFSDVYFWDPPSSEVASLGSVHDFEKALTQTLADIGRAGHEVVLIYPMHRYNGTPYSWNTCTTIKSFLGDCEWAAPLDYVERLQQPVRSAIDRVVRNAEATVLDFRPFVCERGLCPIRKDGSWLFADEAHISAELSQSLGPELVHPLGNGN